MLPVDFIGHQIDPGRWAVPLNVELSRLHPGRCQVYVSLFCLHLAFSVAVPRRMPQREG